MTELRIRARPPRVPPTRAGMLGGSFLGVFLPASGVVWGLGLGVVKGLLGWVEEER